jgi:hypothetical protein
MIALEGVSKTYPKQSKPAVAELNLPISCADGSDT